MNTSRPDGKKAVQVLLSPALWTDISILAKEGEETLAAYIRRIMVRDTATKMKRRARKEEAHG